MSHFYNPDSPKNMGMHHPSVHLWLDLKWESISDFEYCFKEYVY